MKVGILAEKELGLGLVLPLQVLRSHNGYYIGTADHDGPCSRESVEYWPTHSAAQLAFLTGKFTQRETC